MKFHYLLLLLLPLHSFEVRAQDPIFTQFFFIRETLNPGFTGFSEGTRAGLLHRTQWPDGNKKIETNYAFLNGMINDKIAIGTTILNQYEVFTNYNYFQINAVYSYKVEIDDDWDFIPGIEVGYGRKNFNFSNLLLEDQINISDESISDGSVDPGVLNYNNKIDFYDISTGFVFTRETTWIGVALKHLNRPDISFKENGNVPLNMLLSWHGGYSFGLRNSPTSILPEGTNLSIMGNYMMQSQYSRLDIGSAMDFGVFSIGATMTTNPQRKSNNSHFVTSVNPFASISVGEFRFGYSYDLNSSAFGNSQGIHELSLTWRADRICIPCPNNYKVKFKRNGENGYQKTW